MLSSILVPSLKDLDDPILDTALPDIFPVDHFLCYKAKVQKKLADGTKLPPFPKGIQVDVVDQFQDRRYDLKKITKLCNPVDKSGTPVLLSKPGKGNPFPIIPATISNPTAHLVCYKANLAKKFIAQTGCGPKVPGDKGTKIEPKQEKHAKLSGIHTNNQFGPEVLDTKKEFELCIPSQKFLPNP